MEVEHPTVEGEAGVRIPLLTGRRGYLRRAVMDVDDEWIDGFGRNSTCTFYGPLFTFMPKEKDFYAEGPTIYGIRLTPFMEME